MTNPQPACEQSDSKHDQPTGLSQFLGKVLDQLSLSAWLPAAMLVGCGAILIQLRTQGNADLGAAIVALTAKPLGILIVLLFALVLATMVSQAFSFTAIRILEGYWRGPLVQLGLYRLMIRRHVRREEKLRSTLRAARRDAFERARRTMLADNVDLYVVHVIEAQQAGKELANWTPEQVEAAREYNWEDYGEAADFGRIVELDKTIKDDYPEPRRMMPTKLGNILRATEDMITPEGEDTEGLVLRRGERIAPRLRQHHDQFRTRLDMYCTLVFIQLLLAALTSVLLVPSPVPAVATSLMIALFVGLALISYSAAIASARGYCTTLRTIVATDAN